ncbi:M4 family metallopeptidase [Phycicoccus sp. CSK15P-2]|uniref:protealysin inhibitor emfourin n=1 Tax=Phycicoccus sp. CSK15P-2 TaxID=2807627 RepID=UPI0019503041|nr:protealysin inhibitor emfourin [Phycicoccus sp. CSK15P-2]MBM6403462.1 M4 family metallopeptidase [Phycicoccus sp. CSK15P-2]
MTAHTPSCTIVPPYVLTALAASQDPRVQGPAESTLLVDEQLRRGRMTAEVRPEGLVERPALDPGTPESPQRAVYDAEQGTTLPGVLVRGEGGPATGDEAVGQAYDGLGDTWTLWREAYDRNSLDDKGLPLLATVHYGRDYDNAFWDGTQMVFGDGDGVVFLGFTRSLDVIGHELAHGVTQYTSGLNYRDQSGALNESVSDVFGVLVKQRVLGQTAEEADWLVGAELLAPGVQGVALRSMAAPGTAYDDPRLGTDPQPAHMRDYVETTGDNGGVHINSGIPNKAFHDFAVAVGGFAWEVAGQVWYDTVTGEIRADCDFETFAGLTLAAATARHGDGSPVVEALRAAWAGVGLGPDAAAGDGPADEVPGDIELDGTDVGDPGGAGADRPSPHTEVSVRRTGGVAGIVLERTVVIGDLPDPDLHAWQGLLVQGRLSGIAEAAQGRREVPDAFHYSVSSPVHPGAVELPEPVLDDDVRALFERTLGF